MFDKNPSLAHLAQLLVITISLLSTSCLSLPIDKMATTSTREEELFQTTPDEFIAVSNVRKPHMPQTDNDYHRFQTMKGTEDLAKATNDKIIEKHKDPVEYHTFKNSVPDTAIQIHGDSSCLEGQNNCGQTPIDNSRIQSMFTSEEFKYLCKVISMGPTANFSHQDLVIIPTEIPSDIVVLDLSRNKISNVPSNVFSKFHNLEELDLSYNEIILLFNDSFVGLGNLKVLNLYHNSLELKDHVYPPLVFKPLFSLQCLKINRNNPNAYEHKTILTYPDQALSWLTNLEVLYLDGIDLVYYAGPGPGFTKLKKLLFVSFAGPDEGFCRMWGIRQDTFQYLSQVEYLNLYHCYIQGRNIDSGAFQHFRNLRELNISHNEEIYVENFDRIFYGLQNAPNLTNLYMDLVINRFSLGICLHAHQLRYFPQHLKTLSIQQNNLEAVDEKVFQMLSPNLETLDLSGNRFVFGVYWLKLPLMSELKNLYVNGASFKVPNIYPYAQPVHERKIVERANCSLYGPQNKKFILHLPPKLETLEMNNAGLNYIISHLIVDENNSLRTLSLSKNHIISLQGPIQGLNNLTHLYLSRNQITTISGYFFQNLTSLQILDLGSNLLGFTLNDYPKTKAFQWLKNLRMLNLSFNDIRVIDKDLFSSLNNLKYILLDSNPLHAFEVNISRLFNLRGIGLTHTQVHTLSHEVMKHIDAILNHGFQISINLSESPILCDCENLKFITWMINSRAFSDSDGFKQYVCLVQGRVYKKIDDGFSNTLSSLNKECTSHSQMFCVVAFVTLLALVIIVGSSIYRFRWHLRYLYCCAYLLYHNAPKVNQRFEFDAFICYDHNDHSFAETTMNNELSKRGLNLLLHGRDFTARNYVTFNIVKAVCRSRKTVVVLTENLIKNPWCNYAIQMAKLTGLNTKRPVLVFVILEKNAAAKLGRDLQYLVINSTYQNFPNETVSEESMQIWWDELANDIKKWLDHRVNHVQFLELER